MSTWMIIGLVILGLIILLVLLAVAGTLLEIFGDGSYDSGGFGGGDSGGGGSSSDW